MWLEWWLQLLTNNHCLQRQYDNGNTIKAWYSPEYILSRLLSDTTIATLRPDIEYSIHGAVHLGLAGDMSTPSASNDFVFFMHHANLDRLWWKWQKTGNKMWTMDGPGPSGISNLSISNQITYYGDVIRNVMQLGYGNMCFVYDDSSALTNSPTSENATAANAASTSNPKVASTIFGTNSTSKNLNRRGNVRRTHKLMPKPSLMPESYAKMHNYNYNDVINHYNDACNFVDTLNDAGYNPVYC